LNDIWINQLKFYGKSEIYLKGIENNQQKYFLGDFKDDN
jgi:hypothetical protein